MKSKHTFSNIIVRTVRQLSAIICIAALVPGNAIAAGTASCSSNAASCAEDTAGATGLAGRSDRALP